MKVIQLLKRKRKTAFITKIITTAVGFITKVGFITNIFIAITHLIQGIIYFLNTTHLDLASAGVSGGIMILIGLITIVGIGTGIGGTDIIAFIGICQRGIIIHGGIGHYYCDN
ncbi:MAG: hypothetical protein ABDI07_07210 [Candidatus Kryptonium sp.]